MGDPELAADLMRREFRIGVVGLDQRDDLPGARSTQAPTDRTVIIAGVDRLRAQFNANAWSGRVEGGYRFVTQGVGVTPYAAGQFTTFELPNYAEAVVSGANTFALAYVRRASRPAAAN